MGNPPSQARGGFQKLTSEISVWIVSELATTRPDSSNPQHSHVTACGRNILSQRLFSYNGPMDQFTLAYWLTCIALRLKPALSLDPRASVRLSSPECERLGDSPSTAPTSLLSRQNVRRFLRGRRKQRAIHQGQSFFHDIQAVAEFLFLDDERWANP